MSFCVNQLCLCNFNQVSKNVNSHCFFFSFFSDSSYKALCISMICVVLYCTVVLSLRTQVDFW